MPPPSAEPLPSCRPSLAQSSASQEWRSLGMGEAGGIWPPGRQKTHTGCRRCAAAWPAEPAAHWWPLCLVTFCAALWFIFALNSSGKARRGGQEPNTRAAAPSPPPGSSKAAHDVPASPACHQQGCHAPTKSSQLLWTIATQCDRPPAPIWTSGNPTMT